VPPAFAGLATAAPGASCAETDLAWPAGGTNCQNAAITYNVYRATTAGFTPGPANRVAAGLPGLAFHDTLLAPGATYHYVVRADDSRSGEESNSVERTVAASLAPDTVAPVYGGLATLQSGVTCGSTEMQWLPALETCSVPLRYNVYRSAAPGFLPDASNRVATVPGTAYVDTALVPGQTYYYKVRALDTAGNEEGNATQAGAAARNLPFILYHQDFVAGDGQWTGITPNDAVLGRFEWADPQGTGAQPEDDATPAPGVNAWVTGPLAGSGLGSFDVDTGTTTIASPLMDISGRPSPQLIMSAFFNNDFGANPGEDPFRVDISSNGGASWTPVLNTLTDIAPWTTLQFAITPTVPATNQFRVRVQTQDLGVGGSLVEAGIDEVTVLQPDAGCAVCSGPVAGVGTILVTRSGDDVVLDWSADPVTAPAYNVHLRSGPGLGTSVRAGTTTTKSFTHAGGALFTGENFYYEVTAVDACGRESPAP
jgi:fibronectin type 3 domain-containing protein